MQECEINTSKKKIYFVINITSLYRNSATCGHNIIFSFDITVIQ